MFSKILTFIIILISFLIYNNMGFSHDYYLGKLTIDHPYITKPIPGSLSAVGYMKIQNKGDNADYLIKIESLFSSKNQVHEMIMDNNIMKMRYLQNGLELPSGKEIILKRDGYHIMFMGLKKELIYGEKEKVILYFKNTGKIIVQFEIKNMNDKGHDH